jgi:hypothetical protein
MGAPRLSDAAKTVARPLPRVALETRTPRSVQLANEARRLRAAVKMPPPAAGVALLAFANAEPNFIVEREEVTRFRSLQQQAARAASLHLLEELTHLVRLATNEAKPRPSGALGPAGVGQRAKV